MNIFKTAILFSAAATILLGITTEQTAVAGTLKLDWNYTIDPSNDSLGGPEKFELHGMALKDDWAANTIWVAITANMPLTGIDTGNPYEGMTVSNGNIGWGDLFFDFSGNNSYQNANDSGSLFGIRFAPNNDSKAPETGVYSGVKATSVVTENAGWWNLHNQNSGLNRRTGVESGMGDLAWNDPYYGIYTTPTTFENSANHIPNIIASGNKIGDITMVGDAELAAAGFALGEFPARGKHTIGFKFDKSLLPIGRYTATLLQECNNDPLAAIGATAVPEPSSILATMLGFGAFGVWRKRKQKLAT
ncbi:MAG: PEP-CTERM sorting domain-containing protein [Oscillatoriales cyanobacterium RU_3_3]|nr:PEP-CTERM sorting domain-containing protein [Microcoleus sp. SU_5_6]NJM62812.1 PEP-CTERM sorting domain-containing protein [Oscillatoriales cyanobacterium RU_3_3]NJR22230.1 PEP-CTERM sorting domain-containing protein [Richelia sp. CSU_2_1]